MNLLTRFFFALAVLLGSGGLVKAGFVPATGFSGGTNSGNFDAPLTLGYSFTTGNHPVSVDALATLTSTTFVPDGRTVRIYQDGSTIDLATATFSSSDPVISLAPVFSTDTTPSRQLLSAPIQLMILFQTSTCFPLFGMEPGCL